MSRSLYARLARRFGPRVDAFTRREFLASTLAASAGLLLSDSGLAAPARPGAAAGKRVVVVGAGFAGLACAHELSSVGYDVTVVEARNRVGGRILSFSDFVSGRNVEGGGELIGSNHPTWVAYKERFQLEFLDVTEDEELANPVVLDGKRLDDKEAAALYDEMDAALGKLNALAAPINEDEPWLAPNAKDLDRKSVKAWIDEQAEASKLCRLGMAVQLAADNAQDIARQSLLGNLAQIKGGGLERYWTESEVFRCKGGNQQLAKILAEKVGKDRVVLQLAVRAIEVARDKVTVTCADGRTIECDDVVLAVPPSVWKRIELKPALPPPLAPQMGVAVKHLSGLKTRFWKEKKLSPDALTDGDISMTWDGTDNQPGDENAALVCFSGGPAAERCRARPAAAREEAYAAALESIYPGYRDQLTGARFMDWPGEPWTQAAYSFPAPGEVTTAGPVLRKGICRLHFAGEHACYKFVGYMEGALNSGVTVAKRLAVRDGASE